MIYKRKIYKQMLDWKEKRQGKSALLIEGARRVGKSTIVEEFGKNEYKSYVLVDFSKADTHLKNIFRNHLNDIDEFFQLFQAETNTRLFPRESLVIFDEIQKFPRAREAIKALVKDGRFDYIETGSLISIKENVDDILIPSEESSIRMFPMDFEEFAIACSEEPILDYIKMCFDKRIMVDQELHYKAMMLLKQYMIVGGMPQSVDAYISGGKSFYESDAAKREILSLYRKDIQKASRRYRTKILQIYDGMPGYLSRHEKRIKISDIDAGQNTDSMGDAFFWLNDSMIVNECFACNDPNVGLSLNENRTFVKCYMGDTGLLLSHTFSEKEIEDDELYKKLLNDRLSINKGMFFENLVAQMLTAKGYDLFFYTHYNEQKHRNDMEIDFLLSNGSKTNFRVNPIEVKSSKNYTTTSLIDFRKKYKKRILDSYVIHPKNYREDNGIIYLPVYMTYLL